MKELTSDNLGEILATTSRVIVQYGANWCGSCRVIKPQFSKFANIYDGITFYYVDAEVYPQSRDFAKVDNLPTFAGFVNGKLVKQSMGIKIERIQEILDEIASH